MYQILMFLIGLAIVSGTARASTPSQELKCSIFQEATDNTSARGWAMQKSQADCQEGEQKAWDFIQTIDDCRACDASACILAAELHGSATIYDESIEYLYARACEYNIGKGCYEYARYLHSSYMWSEAKSLYVKSCQAEFTPACIAYGLLLLADKKYNEADNYFRAACTLDDQVGCFKSAELELKLNSNPDDVDNILENLAQICELEMSGDACAELGFIFWDGKGVLQDRERAKIYFALSCQKRVANGEDPNEDYICKLT